MRKTKNYLTQQHFPISKQKLLHCIGILFQTNTCLLLSKFGYNTLMSLFVNVWVKISLWNRALRHFPIYISSHIKQWIVKVKSMSLPSQKPHKGKHCHLHTNQLSPCLSNSDMSCSLIVVAVDLYELLTQWKLAKSYFINDLSSQEMGPF